MVFTPVKALLDDAKTLGNEYKKSKSESKEIRPNLPSTQAILSILLMQRN